MTSETPDAGGAEPTSILTAAFESFATAVPDWTTMPATALFTFLDDQLFSAREWAFKSHSPSHAKAWKERVARYQKVLPKVKEAAGIEEEPEVTDELGKTLLLVTGAAVGLIAQAMELVDDETGEVDFEEVWTDEFLQSAQHAQMETWGDQSFTWIVLKLRELADELRGSVMLYECKECDPSEVTLRTLPILVLASAVLFAMAIEHLDDETKEKLRQTLADAAGEHAHAPPETN